VPIISLLQITNEENTAWPPSEVHAHAPWWQGEMQCKPQPSERFDVAVQQNGVFNPEFMAFVDSKHESFLWKWGFCLIMALFYIQNHCH